MDGAVTAWITEGIALLRLDSAPANALGPRLRRALSDALDKVSEDPSLKGLVLSSSGSNFSAGADLREPGRPAPPGTPDLSEICKRLESLTVPVVAALPGPALGAGAELALAAHYRVAAAGARFGLPDIALGLGPAAGGGQRLARLAGAETALSLLLRGRGIDAAAARDAGIYDAVVSGDPEQEGLVLVRHLAEAGIRPRPVIGRRNRMQDGIAWLETVAKHRRTARAAPLHAAGRIVDCIEVALLLPGHAGLIFERAAYRDGLADPQFEALRHIHLAERLAPNSLLQRDGGRLRPTAAGARQVAALNEAQSGEIDARRRLGAILAWSARLISAGRARAADLDALAVHGLGWPRLSGGPLHQARGDGLADLVAQMRSWASDNPVFAVSPVLERAAAGDGDLDAAANAAAPQVRTG